MFKKNSHSILSPSFCHSFATYDQEHLPTVHSRYKHRSSALPEGPHGGLPSLSLTTEGSWIHLWREGRQASHQLSDANTPLPGDRKGIRPGKISHQQTPMFFRSSGHTRHTWERSPDQICQLNRN